MEITTQDAKQEMEGREIILRLDPDTYPDKMAGYLTALYDLGFLSFDETREYEKKFGVVVFSDD